MLRTLRPFSLLCLLFLLPATATFAQTTIHVGPGLTYTTIQAGINAANTGDTVEVAAGTYFENIAFHGKNITLTGVTPAPGQAPPAILDGSSLGPAISIADGESPTISYLTIQHGGSFTAGPNTPATGGIVIANGSPTIVHNLITNNNCWAIDINGSPYVADNTISSTLDPNGACGFAGGAGILIGGDQIIAISGSQVPAVIFANIIENNVQNGFEETGSSGGAGIAIAGGTPSIIGNVIHDNASPGGTGAGINVFASAGHSGRSIAVLENILYNNRAGCGGGAIATPPSRNDGQINLLIANNTMVNNTGDDSAGYMECQSISQIYPSPYSADDFDSGYLSGPDTVIVNNIISGSTTDPAVNCTPLLAPSEAIQPRFDHNILYNAGGAFFGSFCIDVSAKYGNLTVDPGFDSDPSRLYHPALGSKAIDAGNNSALSYIQQVSGSPLATDAAGTLRVQDATTKGYPVIDIGAYEYPGASGTATESAPTTLVLTSNAYAGPANSSFTLTATIAGSTTGSITFYNDNQALGSAAISNGVAQQSFVLGPGVHGIYATYTGAAGVAPAISVPIIIDVAKISTSLTLNSDALPVGSEPSRYSVVGQSVLFTITTVADDGSIIQPITLTNLKTNTVLASGLTPGPNGIATFTTSFSTPDTFNIKAEYAGTPNYAEASDTITQTVKGYPTTVTLNCPASVPFGGTAAVSATVTSTNGTPTGQLFFSDAGVDFGGDPQLVNGSATATYTGVNSGNRTIIAQYKASGAFSGNSAMCSISVGSQNTLTLISSSPLVNGIPTSPAYTPITFTATLSTTTSLTGQYSINIPGVPGFPATMQAGASGTTATYTTSTLSQGQYNVTVSFIWNNNIAPPAPAMLYPYQLVTAPTGDFTLTGPSSLTTRTESPASGTLSLTSIDNFQGTVALTCNLPLPTTYTCAIAPTGVPLAVGGSGSATVTLTPSLNRAAKDSSSRIVFASLFPLTLLSLAGFRRSRTLRRLLPLVVLAVLAASTTACGKDVYVSATQPGSYPFTVTATGTTLGATAPTTHTLNITLVLTP